MPSYLLAGAVALLLVWAGWGSPPMRIGTSGALTGSTALVADTVYVVLVPGLSWDDVLVLRSSPGWDRLLSEGAIAGLNTQTAGTGSRAESYLTLSSGSRARMPDKVPQVYGRDEMAHHLTPAIELREQLRGAPGADAVFVPAWQEIVAEQGRVLHTVSPGLLGDRLADLSLPVSILANADLPDTPDRTAALVAVDGAGGVGSGRVDAGLLAQEGGFAGGRVMDWSTVMDEIDGGVLSGGLVVVEASDLARLLTCKSRLEPGHWERLWAESLASVGNFLGWIMGRGEERGEVLMLVLSPHATREMRASRDCLLPAVMWGQGEGLLVSPTTRQRGVVANIDVAATIASALGGGEEPLGYGRPVRVAPGDADLEALALLAGAAAANDRRRAPMVQTYVGLVVLTVAAVLAACLRAGRVRELAASLALTSMTFPSVMVAMGSIPSAGQTLSLLLAVGASAAGAVLSGRLRTPAVTLSAITFALVVADVWAGSVLARGAPLGFSLVAGARYYGIGNEMAGLLAGAALYLAASLPRPLAPLVLVLAVLTTGAPNLGANLGVTIALVAGAVPLVAGMRRPFATLGLAALAALATALALFALDLVRDPGAHSHLAMVLRQGDRVSELVLTAARKLDMSARLFRWTVWTRAWAASMIGFLALLIARPALLRDVLGSRPRLEGALWGALLASLVALVVNDSGVVVGATLLVFPVLGTSHAVVTSGAVRGPAPGGQRD